MKIAIIGALGIVGRALVEHFCFLKHTVIEVDLNSDITIEQASKEADVIFIVTLPLVDVQDIVALVSRHIKTNSLIIHGSSVEQIKGNRKVSKSLFIDKNIALCHCHFHFLPEIPLRRTLPGQHITTFFSGAKIDMWENWLKDQFIQSDPFWHKLSRDEHDEITSISQLMHMSLAFTLGDAWSREDKDLVRKGIMIGGPPLRFLVRSIMRTSRGAGVAAEIIIENPHTLRVIEMIRKALARVEEYVKSRDKESLVNIGSTTRSILDQTLLSELDESTAALLRFEADRRGENIVTFHFSAEENRDSLLADVLHEFGKGKIDLTTTFAQEDPDGGCTFLIGVRIHDKNVTHAIKAVKAWKHL